MEQPPRSIFFTIRQTNPALGEEAGVFHILLVIGSEGDNVLRDKVDANRMPQRCKHLGENRNLLGFLRYIGNLLRDDQIHLAVHTVLEKPAPFRGAFHIRSGRAFINIEINQVPLWTQSNGIDKTLLVEFQVILVPRLIEIPDVDADLVRFGYKRPIAADRV